MTFQVATFYKFAPLPDAEVWHRGLRRLCQEQAIKGTILLASEGINATISGKSSNLETVVAFFQADQRFQAMHIKWSEYERRPFRRMKVRIKDEIVTIGDSSVDPTSTVGQYVAPDKWNQLLDDPAVTVVDTRNDFEVAIGTFDSAVNPKTQSFRQFKSFVDQNLSPEKNPEVALFCTGGIRCEKATSFMLDRGFKAVYHLDGGILNYLTQIDETESRWRGECFVFDDRVAVTHGARPGSFKNCQECGQKLAESELASRSFTSGICCNSCLQLPLEDSRTASGRAE